MNNNFGAGDSNGVGNSTDSDRESSGSSVDAVLQQVTTEFWELTAVIGRFSADTAEHLGLGKAVAQGESGCKICCPKLRHGRMTSARALLES
jgi:hypothetical protein